MSEAHILERDGCPIHYWLVGQENAPLIVFTHGGQVDHRMFEEQMTALIDHFRVLTWDMRGHGLSQPLRGNLSYRSIAHDIVALLDVVGADRAVLVGHSMGGCASQEVAYKYPERVRALVLIGAPCVMEPNPKGTKTYGRILRILGHILPEKIYRDLMQGAARAFSIDSAVQAYIRETTSLVSKATFMAIGRAVLTGYHPEPDYRIAQPLLLTHGDQDGAAICKQAPTWAAREPNCQYVVIPQAGHNANQDNPAFFNETLSGFLTYPTNDW